MTDDHGEDNEGEKEDEKQSIGNTDVPGSGIHHDAHDGPAGICR